MFVGHRASRAVGQPGRAAWRSSLAGQPGAYQVMNWGKVNHRVDVCSEVRWVGCCSGGSAKVMRCKLGAPTVLVAK